MRDPLALSISVGEGNVMELVLAQVMLTVATVPLPTVQVRVTKSPGILGEDGLTFSVMDGTKSGVKEGKF